VDEQQKKELASTITRMNSGFTREMDFAFVEASEDAVAVEFTVAEKHLQPFGIVHGGVHAGAIETVCSIGAGIAARVRGHVGGVVGLENHTSFIRAVTPGTKLKARATPVTRGRTTHVWKAEVTDPHGRIVAQGTVRLLCVTPDQLGKPASAS
jgi:1,4-dihydroxy-2-naphthoyl-CoA hydrolase